MARRSERIRRREEELVDQTTESKAGKRRVEEAVVEEIDIEELLPSLDRSGRRGYIGLYSPEERKKLFIEHFKLDDKPSEAKTVHSLRKALENPFDKKSWLTRKQLTDRSKKPASYQADAFLDRYSVTRHIIPKTHSITNPSLYLIDNLTDYFKHILYERGDLFMKIVPLYDQKAGRAISDDDLDEIYTEVVVAYFLNELVYGYKHVASLHFMTIVDWFLAMKYSIVAPDSPDDTPEFPFYHQVIISEKVDYVAKDYFEMNTNMREVRATLFQTFHALEVAWNTHKFTHNDLHLGNVMYKKIEKDSVFEGKNFLYNRLEKPNWYLVPKEDLNGKFVKIIDFGRNRLYVPTQRDEEFPNPTNRHNHSRLVCASGLESLGITPANPTRRMDIYIPLLQILSFPYLFWYAAGLTEEGAALREQFFDLCNKAIHFNEITLIARDYYKDKYKTVDDHPDEGVDAKKVKDEYIAIGGRVSARNFYRCPAIYDLIRRRGICIYKYATTQFHLNDVLDHPFFEAYKQESLVQVDKPLSPDDIVNARDGNIVVSFLENSDGPLMMNSTPSGGNGGEACHRCDSCKSTNISHKTNQDYFCSMACYEFKYIFDSKTVYR